jgi:gamma-tubulin complex component 2
LKQERSSLLKKLTTLKDLGCAYSSDKFAAVDIDQPMTLSMTGLETFSLGYKVLFVFSLNISHGVYLVIVK